MTDEELNYWGDQFVAAELSVAVSFGSFIALPVARRRDLVERATRYQAQRVEAEGDLPATTEIHGAHLVDPMRPTLRRWLRPWYLIARRREQRRGHRGQSS